MAKKKPVKKKQSIKRAKAKPVTRTLLQKIEEFLDNRHHIIALVITGLSLILAVMMFDAKISMGLDDSTYIEQGFKYSTDFWNHYFTAQAPFYAMFLALPIKLFGINLVLIKMINVIFFVASVYIFYRGFRFRIGWLILFSALVIYATNTEALRMASLTYTEALYLFIQSIFLYVGIRVIERLDNKKSIVENLKSNWLILLVLSVIFYFLFLTRTVGIATFAIFIVFYIFKKQYKLGLVVGTVMGLVYVALGALKGMIWESTNQFSTQAKILSQKDAYDASQGYEDFSGFIERVLDNTNQFFSSRFFEILGLREYPSEWNWGLAFFILIPLIWSLIRAFKKNNYAIAFAVLYVGAICAFSFLGMQKSWGQARYIMILLAPIFLGVFWLLTEWFSKENSSGYQFFALIIMLFFVLVNFGNSFKIAQNNIPIARANLIKGDMYKGFTPDWVNFLKLSKWCGDSLSDNELVASRKAPMSFIYSNGKEFHPIWSTTPNPDPDSTLASWKKNGITHVILGNLRVNAKTSQAGIINTVHRILQPIQNKYPEKLVMVRKEGEYEESVLIKIDY